MPHDGVVIDSSKTGICSLTRRDAGTVLRCRAPSVMDASFRVIRKSMDEMVTVRELWAAKVLSGGQECCSSRDVTSQCMGRRDSLTSRKTIHQQPASPPS